MLVGCIAMLAIGLYQVGGFSGLRGTVPEGLTADEYDGFFHMMRPASDKDYPWPGLLFGVQPIGLWYWSGLRRPQGSREFGGHPPTLPSF
jgi:SSS family solute:Na+ symporter